MQIYLKLHISMPPYTIDSYKCNLYSFFLIIVIFFELYHFLISLWSVGFKNTTLCFNGCK
jgi:hypothetical protein